uniref:Ajuba LIM protein n=1 Tax=Tetraodon nigroviridis TaxID=99883 RepID=H3D8K3_TETNG
MDRPISKLLEKLKLTDSGSAKFNSSKKKHDAAGNANNSNANAAGVTPPPAPTAASLSRPGQFSLASATASDEALFYKRLSTGSELWESTRPASLSHPPHRASDASGPGGGFFYPPGPTLSPCSSFSLQESVLVSPRSSFASSTGPMGSRCSSNRTSGISLGYDSRYSASGGLPAQQHATSLQTGGSALGYGAPGRPGVTPVEDWTQYLGGEVAPGTQDTRHSYPPAVGSPAAACYQAGPEWWDEQRAGARGKDGARYSDLPGTRYQEELTRLLLRVYGSDGACSPAGSSVPSEVPPVGLNQSDPAGFSRGANRLKPPPAARSTWAGTCVKCGKGVYGADNACQALDSLYHTRCFTCVSCGRTLRNKDFYNVNGSVYCKEDYMFSGFQAAAEKCSVCGHLILEQILQALGNSYHPGCFRCVVCSKALDGVPFTVDHHSNIYCVADYNKTFAPKCAACCQPILPAEGSEEILRVVSMNKDYHFECYHCEECGKQLSDQPGSQCFPLDSHLLCHSCHMSRVCA